MNPRYLLATVLAAIVPLFFTSSCGETEPWGELPEKISEFIQQYFPNSGIDDFTESSATYHVRIENGPGLTFDKQCEWEAVNGYGMPLPQVLLFDQLPPALYTYLEGTGNLGEVFSIERNSGYYTVVLLDSTVRYDIATQEITGSDKPS